MHSTTAERAAPRLFIRVPDAARLFNRTEQTIRAWARQGVAAHLDGGAKSKGLLIDVESLRTVLAWREGTDGANVARLDQWIRDYRGAA